MTTFKMPHHVWTDAEIEILRAQYPISNGVDLAELFGVPRCVLYAKAAKLGLAKAPGTAARIARQKMADPSHGGHRHFFEKGHAPANKGLRRPGWFTGRMRETQFKPGQKNHNWLPVGSLRINSDGYVDRKVTDTGYPPRDWQGVHRLVWIEAHGPIPAKHSVVFLPGRRTTDPALITLDALELVSRAELMRRNTIHHMPPELADVARLRGRLKRAINDQAKEAEAP